MSQSAIRHAIVIGGGASGVLLAHQLLHHPASNFRVTLIETRSEIGRGLAYHTGNPDHLLNVRAANMSALPDQPDHFWRWASSQDIAICPDPFCFVPRRVYGTYIAGLIEPIIASDSHRLTIVQDTCVEVRESATSVEVTLAGGHRLTGDIAVLATGHDTGEPKPGAYANPWAPPVGMDRDSAVLILGTGLTMVDYVLSLLREGHRGPIVAMSRRGLLATAHRRVEPMRIEEVDVPFGQGSGELFRWFRRRVDAHMAGGGDWRSVVDAIRPHTQRIWRELSVPSRRRFLEHARAWWDVHRHRMAPEVETRIANALAEQKLKIMAAKMVALTANEGGGSVRYRRRGEREVRAMQVGAVVDCTGVVKDPRVTANPVVRNLLQEDRARIDALGIGIDVSADCAIVDGNGSPSHRLFAVGPLTRAAFWEIIAIPDIRNQCAELAARLARA